VLEKKPLSFAQVQAGVGKRMPEDRFAGLNISDFNLGLPPIQLDKSNKRVHIQFHHGGVMSGIFNAMGGNHKLVDEKILGSVWMAVGFVTDSFYHAEYS